MHTADPGTHTEVYMQHVCTHGGLPHGHSHTGPLGPSVAGWLRGLPGMWGPGPRANSEAGGCAANAPIGAL